MTIIPAQIAIANLIDSAEKGEIDPWDVPVIETIDRFIKELGLMDELSPTEADLPQSGQAFLWASMLILFKADTLQLLQEINCQEDSETEFFEDFALDGVEGRSSLPPFLENHLRRRTSVPPRGKRKVTLQELIEQLEEIAAEIESVTEGDSLTKPQRTKTSRRAAMQAIANLAHNENLTELAIQLETFLLRKYPQLSPSREFVNWEHLLTGWHQDNSDLNSQHHHDTEDRAGVFWALLLLSSQSKVELSQEEFYQDLSIKPLINL